LIQWGTVDNLDDFRSVAMPYFVNNPGKCFIDNSYDQRAFEVKKWVVDQISVDKGIQCFYPTYGRDHLNNDIGEKKKNFVYEGHQGNPNVWIWSFTFRPDVFKTKLLDRIKGLVKSEWLVYQDIDFEYQFQVTSEECRDNVWKIKRGHGKENHLFDCEVLQLMAAQLEGLG
jgi:hypothetical protein